MKLTINPFLEGGLPVGTKYNTKQRMNNPRKMELNFKHN